MIKAVLLMLLMALLPWPRVYGQRDSTLRWWIAGSYTGNNVGPGLQGDLHYSIRRHVFGARYLNSLEFFPKYIRLNKPVKVESLSLLYGRSFGNKYVSIIPMGGLIVGQGNWRTSRTTTEEVDPGFWGSPYTRTIYHYAPFRFVGVTAGATLLYAPTPFLGFSLDAYCNLHPHPVYGIAMGLVLGRLWPRERHKNVDACDFKNP